MWQIGCRCSAISVSGTQVRSACSSSERRSIAERSSARKNSTRPRPAALGVVEREVGVREQHVDVVAVIGEHRDADARVDRRVGRVVVVLERREPEPRLVCEERGVGGPVDVAEHDHELVAADPHEHVVGADALGEPLPDEPQDPVAEAVAVLVVDVLEAVEVEQQHGGPTAGGSPVGEDRRELLVEHLTAGDARERIGARGTFERLALVHHLGDVAPDHQHRREQTVRVELGHELHVVDVLLARVAIDVALLRRERSRLGDAPVDRLRDLDELPGRPADAGVAEQRLGRAAHERRERRVDVHAPRLAIPTADEVGGVLGERAELPFAER